MNVSLTDKQEDYIKRQIASGDYQNASELVRDALRAHEQSHRARLMDELRMEIMKGEQSGLSARGIQDILNDQKQSD